MSNSVSTEIKRRRSKVQKIERFLEKDTEIKYFVSKGKNWNLFLRGKIKGIFQQDVFSFISYEILCTTDIDK